MPAGMYRTEDEWVCVNYGAHSIRVPRARYEENGYRPAFDELPVRSVGEASAQRHKNNTSTISLMSRLQN